MKLLRRCTSNARVNQFSLSRVWLYSTRTVTSFSSKDTLFSRISPEGSPKVSIVPILDRWLREGRRVDQKELQVIIKLLRRFKRYAHALEVSEWMSNKRYLPLSAGDVAVRLDLISKVHGVEQSEKYFNNIPIKLKQLGVHGALLNCYAYAKSLEKAEATMQKIRELGFARTSLPYNVMLKLYADIGQHEKLDSLMQEMEEKGITWDSFTLTTRLMAYAIASDFEGMEKLLMKMEADHAVRINWSSYVVAANGYSRAGMVEKASAMLKKSEQLIKGKIRRDACPVLLSLYASIGDKDEVYRMWNLYKKTGKTHNMSYISMISSLAKLDDLVGAEKIWEEWDAEKLFFDSRVSNVLISAYCKKGLVGNAESIIERIIESGEEPDASSWQHLAAAYHEDGQMEKAVETMKKVILASRSGWKVNFATLAACIEYLRGKGSIKASEELVELLQEKGRISKEISNRLVNFVESGNPALLALDFVEGKDPALEGEKVIELKSQSASSIVKDSVIVIRPIII